MNASNANAPAEAANPLAQLKDIHLPEPVSAWPPAYGWWILLAVIVIAILSALIAWRKRKKRLLGQKTALNLLKQMIVSDKDWPTQMNQVLKRLALSYFPHVNTAQLHGQGWNRFLTEQLPAKQQDQFSQSYQTLLDSLYAKSIDLRPLDFNAYQALVSNWIKQAVPPKKPALKRTNNRKKVAATGISGKSNSTASEVTANHASQVSQGASHV